MGYQDHPAQLVHLQTQVDLALQAKVRVQKVHPQVHPQVPVLVLVLVLALVLVLVLVQIQMM